MSGHQFPLSSEMNWTVFCQISNIGTYMCFVRGRFPWFILLDLICVQVHEPWSFVHPKPSRTQCLWNWNNFLLDRFQFYKCGKVRSTEFAKWLKTTQGQKCINVFSKLAHASESMNPGLLSLVFIPTFSGIRPEEIRDFSHSCMTFIHSCAGKLHANLASPTHDQDPEADLMITN